VQATRFLIPLALPLLLGATAVMAVEPAARPDGARLYAQR